MPYKAEALSLLVPIGTPGRDFKEMDLTGGGHSSASNTATTTPFDTAIAYSFGPFRLCGMNLPRIASRIICADRFVCLVNADQRDKVFFLKAYSVKKSPTQPFLKERLHETIPATLQHQEKCVDTTPAVLLSIPADEKLLWRNSFCAAAFLSVKAIHRCRV